MVSLSGLISPDCIQLEAPATSKVDLIRSMVDQMARAGRIADPDRVLGSLLEREKVMSTGIGSGVAIPHAQCAAASSLTVGLARTAADIDFQSLDDKPVRLVFLVVGPEERGGFIRILARISRLLYTGELQERLAYAESPADALRIITQEEENLRL